MKLHSLYIKDTILVSFLLLWLKHPEKGFILAPSSKLQSIILGKSEQELEAAGHIHSQEQRQCVHAGLPVQYHSYIVRSPAIHIQGGSSHLIYLNQEPPFPFASHKPTG